MELPATDIGGVVHETPALFERRKEGVASRLMQIENENKQYYLDECEKLDAYSEDLKEGLERELKELRKLITERRKTLRTSKDTEPLDVLVDMKDEINKLEEKRKTLQREIYNRQDEIEAENERLQEEIRARLDGTSRIEHIMAFSFEIA
jgi:septal ring factor EnvC (AmiA/AmiB activator)